MASSKKLQIEIIGDASSLSRAFGKASQSGSKFGAMMGKTAKLAGVGLVAMAGGAAAAGVKMISLASDAAEVQSKLEVVFGKQLPGLTKNIDSFSKATGASKFAMREQAADMGALLAPMLGSKKGAADMSLQFTKLATDLGSFNNIPVGDALEKIRAGLVGESEPLRSLGVLLTEATTKEFAYAKGIAKRGAVLTEVQKVEARAGQIMAQTKLAQGDAIRTADSLANQWKRLKNGLTDFATTGGQLLAPFATKVVASMNTALAAVSGFSAKLGAAKGLEAKVGVVFEAAGTLATKAAKVGVDIGKQIADALGKVDWAATGNKIAAGIGAAFKKGIPALAQFAQTITEGFQKAIQQADWVTIGASIGQGIKDGVKKAAKKKITEGLDDTIRASAGPVLPAALSLASQVAGAIANRFGGKIKETMPSKMALVPLAIKRGVDPAIAVATAGGGRIGAGLSGGLTAALSGVGASVANTIIAQLNSTELQLKQKYGIHSPSQRWMEMLGKPLAQGIVQGLDGGLALLAPTMAKKIQAAVTRAQAVVAGARARMQASFSLFSDKLLRAFDAETGGTLSPAGQQLAAITARRQQEDLASAVEGAQGRLAEAMQGGDAAAITDAQRALFRAQEDVQAASLQVQDSAWQKSWTDQREAMRESLVSRSALLGASLTKDGATVKSALAAINKLMQSFGITFAESGQFIGKHFVAGLQTAIGGAAAGAGGVRGAQTGGNASPKVPTIIVQSILDGKVVSESVRRHDAIYARANGALAI